MLYFKKYKLKITWFKNPKVVGFRIFIILLVTSFLLYKYCCYNYPFWIFYSPENFISLKWYKTRNIKGYRGKQIFFHKDFLSTMQSIDSLAKNEDIKIVVTQGYRLPGRKLNNTIVKPASKSNHLAGHALDFNIRYKSRTYQSFHLGKSNFEKLPKNIQNFIYGLKCINGIRWGGDFAIEDPIHIDGRLNIITPALWE